MEWWEDPGKYKPGHGIYYNKNGYTQIIKNEKVLKEVNELYSKHDGVFYKLNIHEYELYRTYIEWTTCVFIDQDGNILIPICRDYQMVLSSIVNGYTNLNQILNSKPQSFLYNLSILNLISVAEYEAVIPGYMNEKQKSTIIEFYKSIMTPMRLLVITKNYISKEIDRKCSLFGFFSYYNTEMHYHADDALSGNDCNFYKITETGHVLSYDANDIDIIGVGEI